MRQLLAITFVASPFVTGCFGSHGNAGAADAGVDARDADGVPDVLMGPDSSFVCECCGTRVATYYGDDCIGTCEAYCPDHCVDAPIDLICDYSHVTADRPTTIPVAFQGCFCSATANCSATVVDGHLELATQSCEDPDVDCDDCIPFLETTCDLPPLEEGTWQVNVNGQPSFELDVVPEGVLPERGSTCLRRAAHDDGCGVGWPPSESTTDVSCHPTHAWPNERVAITVTDPCGGCGAAAGPCKVDVFDDVIRVRPSTVFSLCDVDCPAICTPREDVCWTPRLEEGTWRVLVDGLGGYTSTIVVGREPETGEVCGPIFPHD